MFGEVSGEIMVYVHGYNASHDQPDAKIQAELFNQVSESFLLLILNVSQKYKDEFFKV